MNKMTLSDLTLKGKKVLVRVDFNVPFNEEGAISDDTRIASSLPTIRYLLEHGASVILMSHLGRPKGKRNPEFSLKPCATRLGELIGSDVIMAPDCIGPKVKGLAENLPPRAILLLENLRFHRAEEHPEEDPSFAKQLAALADLYVNDAFGSAHRAHSSTATITQYFPDKAAAGLLLQKEIDFLSQTVVNPKRPFCAIIGGAKISTKLGLLKSLMNKADKILIGGGMAYTFFKAQGIPIGSSIHEDSLIDQAKEILEAARRTSVRFLLPVDNIVADKLTENAKLRILPSNRGFPQGWQGVDIGPETIRLYTEEIANSATVFWNGPLGVFEIPAFANGTNEIAHVVSNVHGTSIVGGGDSIAALGSAGLKEKITHISTGGGATLEFIEHGTLPGIDALSNKKLACAKN